MIFNLEYPWYFRAHPLFYVSLAIDGTNLQEYVSTEDLIKSGAKNEKGEWQVPMKSLQQGAASYVIGSYGCRLLNFAHKYY